MYPYQRNLKKLQDSYISFNDPHYWGRSLKNKHRQVLRSSAGFQADSEPKNVKVKSLF